jgi:hypothetical protein
MTIIVFYARTSADINRVERGIQAQHSTNHATTEASTGPSPESAAKSMIVPDEFEVMLRGLRSGKPPQR